MQSLVHLASNPRLSGCQVRTALAVLVLGLAFAGPARFASAQGAGAEIEPNNSCATAQDLGAIGASLVMNGELLPGANALDLDFFKVSGPPGASFRVDLEGVATGQGSLGDPYLGFFDSGCGLLAISDDFGSTNSRLIATVPPDGTMIFGATACCDPTFSVGGMGSYRLGLQPVQAAGPVSGRVVDALTGTPLTGDYPHYTSVELRRCEAGDCGIPVASSTTDAQGRFHFVQDQRTGMPLEPGQYVARATVGTSFRYEPLETAPFDLQLNTPLDLGDLGLRPYPPIGSISGRLLDAATGQPLAGATRPYATVELRRCSDPFSCYETLATAATGADGRFRFERDSQGNPLVAVTYQIVANAEQYQGHLGEPFAVAAGADQVLDDILLASPPLRFSEIRPCGDLPREGGTCRYSVRLANGQAEPIVGGAWSIVTVGDAWTGAQSVFQAGGVRVVQLDPGASEVVRFRFAVPAELPNGTSICVRALAGRGDPAYFNLLASRDLFCIAKGASGFLLSDPDGAAFGSAGGSVKAAARPE